MLYETHKVKKNIIWMGLGRGHSMELKEYISDLFFLEIINSVIACTTSYFVYLREVYFEWISLMTKLRYFKLLILFYF